MQRCISGALARVAGRALPPQRSTLQAQQPCLLRTALQAAPETPGARSQKAEARKLLNKETQQAAKAAGPRRSAADGPASSREATDAGSVPRLCKARADSTRSCLHLLPSLPTRIFLLKRGGQPTGDSQAALRFQSRLQQAFQPLNEPLHRGNFNAGPRSMWRGVTPGCGGDD
jgi:hypothetical protein